jgi:alpha-beta hydrolase superfamily lysophospholipase
MSIKLPIDNKFIYEFFADNEIIKGVVVISHGMAEHINRYKWLIKQLNASGYHVVCADHLGHGKYINDGAAPGYFSDVDDFEDVENNLIHILDYVSHKFADLNKILIGHSMGSWIAMGVIQRYQNIDALILTGSSLIPKETVLAQRRLVTFLSFLFGKKSYSKFIDRMTMRKYNNIFSPNRTPNDWITRDESSVDEYTDDPKCGFLVTNSLWYQLSNQMLKVFDINKYINSNIDLPIYLISGDKDPVGINGKGVKSLHEFLIQKFYKTEINLVAGARHEVFNEINKQESFKDLIKFIDSNIE